MAGTTVPFTLASGDILPVATTAIVANVATIVDIDFDGDLGEMFVVFGTARGHITWLDSGGLVLNAQEIPAGAAWDWLNEGQANPLTGNPVASAQISNGDSTVTNDMKIGVLYAA